MKYQAIKEFSLQKYTGQNFEISYTTRGTPGAPDIVWAHGWGQSHAAFLPLIQPFEGTAHHTLIDFPGFGASPLPGAIWGTADYADAVATFLRATFGKPVVWVGHSFGCRVGLQLAARHPDVVSGLFLIAAAGLKPKRSAFKAAYIKCRILLFKSLKKLIPLGLNEQKLYAFFGSRDYRNAAGLRPIFVKVVNEDLSDTARAVKCLVTLVYGTFDTETPVEIGRRLNALIPQSELLVLDELDHYSVLGEGRHRVTPLLKKFLEKNGNVYA
jgi:pimeloyl-ACP methyl ester carboxylesterase